MGNAHPELKRFAEEQIGNLAIYQVSVTILKIKTVFPSFFYTYRLLSHAPKES